MQAADQACRDQLPLRAGDGEPMLHVGGDFLPAQRPQVIARDDALRQLA